MPATTTTSTHTTAPMHSNTQRPSFLKYITTTRYNDKMFEIVELSPEQDSFFKVKPYKDAFYTFIKQSKLKCDTDLIKNAIYKVTNIKDWIYEKDGNKYGCVRYYIQLKEKPKDDKKKSTPLLFKGWD